MPWEQYLLSSYRALRETPNLSAHTAIGVCRSVNAIIEALSVVAEADMHCELDDHHSRSH
jgi:hypothetical protein